MIKKLFTKKNNKGFTFAELLVVVAIVGVLVAVSIPVFSGQIEKSRNTVDMHTAKVISNAIIYYLMDNPEAMAEVTRLCDAGGGKHCVQVSVSKDNTAITNVLRPALNQAGLIGKYTDSSLERYKELTCESKKNWIGYRIAVSNYSGTQGKPGAVRIYYWGVPEGEDVFTTASWSVYQNDPDSTGFKEAMRGK